jgi:glycosyltransferase involved in cell wall biosynthesis
MTSILSVATASHNPRFLGELAESLKRQTLQDFEWVVLVNGDKPIEEFHLAVAPVADKTRLVRAPEGTPPNVGAVKKLAFEAAANELIVEVDHDDVLAPNALEQVWDAFKKTGADFLYSDMAVVEEGSTSDLGAASWPSVAQSRLYKAVVDGIEITACKVVPVSPAFFFTCSMAGPCHIRAFRKSFYEKVGGHRTDFTISDDYELITRMYVAGAKFHHIEACLYFYRVFAENTSNTRNHESNEFTEYYRSMIQPVLKRWADDNGLKGATTLAELEQAFEHGEANSLAYLIADDSFGLVADQSKFLDRAHELLIHGGWLQVRSKVWKQEWVYARTRPGSTLTPSTKKFQELEVWCDFERDHDGAVRLDRYNGLATLLVAKKSAAPLHGRGDYWSVKADPWLARHFRPLFSEVNATFIQKDNHFEIYGGSMAAKLVENANREHPGVFKFCGPKRGELVPTMLTNKDRTLAEIWKTTPKEKFLVVLFGKHRQIELDMQMWNLQTLVTHLLLSASRHGYDKFAILDPARTRVLFEFDPETFDRGFGKSLPPNIIEAHAKGKLVRL